MAVVAMVPLLVIGGVSARVARESSARVAEQQLALPVREQASVIETWLQTQLANLEGWMQVFSVQDLDLERREGLVRAIYRAVPTAGSVVLVDAEGNQASAPAYLTRVYGPDHPLGGRVVGSPERVEAMVERLAPVAAGQTSALGGVWFPDGPDAPPSVAVKVPAPGGVGLALALELSLAPLVATLERRSSPEQAFALFTLDGEALEGGAHPLIAPLEIDSLLSTFSTFRFEPEGAPALRGAVANLEIAPWAVVSSKEAAVVEQAGRRTLSQLAWGLVLAVVLAALWGPWLARNLAEPVARLRDGALGLAEGDFHRRVGVEGALEVRELSEAFNHMAERLENNQQRLAAQQEEIEAFNAELQERVRARTRELEQAQAKLVESGQLAAVAELSAGLAHELNNPLASILGLTQVLRQRAGESDARAQRLLASLETEAVRCREVVKAMQTLEAGEVDPSVAPVVDLRIVLDEVLTVVQAPFRQRGVDVALEQTDEALEVRADPVLLRRMLIQVLQSLRAGLSQGASLSISASRSEGRVRVSLLPDRPVASSDDFRAQGAGLWVARRALDGLGGRLNPATATQAAWTLELEGA